MNRCCPLLYCPSLTPILRAIPFAFVMHMSNRKAARGNAAKIRPRFALYFNITIEVGVPGTGYAPTEIRLLLPLLSLNDWIFGVDWFPTNT